MHIAIIPSPLGNLKITADTHAITQLEFTHEKISSFPPHELLIQCIKELQTYFKNPKHVFNLPLAPKGSDYQKKVWQAIAEIPPSTVLTYGDLAKILQSGPRAIGGACRNNPIPIIVPCHRIVGANSMGGYMGTIPKGEMSIKEWLLKHEKVAGY